MHGSSGVKGDGMVLEIMVVTGSDEGKMAEQKPEENWVDQEEIQKGDERLVYDCCDLHD